MNTEALSAASLLFSVASARGLFHRHTQSSPPDREASYALPWKQQVRKYADREEGAGPREVARALTTS